MTFELAYQSIITVVVFYAIAFLVLHLLDNRYFIVDKMKKTSLLIWGIVLSGLVGYIWGVHVGKTRTCGDLVAKLENELDIQKEVGYQRDIDNIDQAGCKNIIIRAINNSNEVKVVGFIQTDFMGNTKVVRVKIDGIEKSFEYHNFMRKVIKVECGDFYKW